ncbi:MAG: hypothetical protein ACRDQ0_13480, partial [Pseudonocardia sp.]
FLVAGRWFLVWLQAIGVRRRRAAKGVQQPTGRRVPKGVMYAAAGSGAWLGPLVLNLVPVNAGLLLGLAGFGAFFAGWGLAPDLFKALDRELKGDQ